MLPSYRNQSIDLQSKSTECFFYERIIGRYWIKVARVVNKKLGFTD